VWEQLKASQRGKRLEERRVWEKVLGSRSGGKLGMWREEKKERMWEWWRALLLEGKLVKKKVGRLARSWERGSERRSRRLQRESENEQERKKGREGRISPKAATSFTLLLN
jgi:hypothetical protein